MMKKIILVLVNDLPNVFFTNIIVKIALLFPVHFD